jgi:hypothetical protein
MYKRCLSLSISLSCLPLLLTSADGRPYQRSYLYDRSHLLVGGTESWKCFFVKVLRKDVDLCTTLGLNR